MGLRRIGIAVSRAGVGSEVWIERQMRGFKNIEPVLLYWDGEPPAGIEAHRFNTPFHRNFSPARAVAKRLGSAYGSYPTHAQAADIRRVVKEARLDAVLCHFAWTGVLVSAALKGSIPVVWHVHGRDVSLKLEQPSFREAVAELLPDVRHLVAVGNHQLDRLRPLGLTDRHSLIPCGAPLSDFAARPIPVRRPGEPLHFISVSRLSDEKGVVETLCAFLEVARVRKDVTLTMIGDGPLSDELNHIADESGKVASIALLGPLPARRIAEELSSAHVFLQHSKEVNGWVEGFGVSLTEAGAAGLPLISSSTGGIVDQVQHGVNGLLFEPGRVTGQIEHMVYLTDNEQHRFTMGCQAREAAQAFDTLLMTSKLESVLMAA